MPVSIKKVGKKYRVSTPNQVHAKGTSKHNAEAQARLLRGIEHGWEPTGQAAHEAMRDDIGSLPIPQAAKAYARRTGLKSMMRQPKDFQRVNAMLMNPGKPDRFKNYEVGADTTGKKPAPKSAIKDGLEAEALVYQLLD